MINYFGLYLSNIPEDITEADDAINTGIQPVALEADKLEAGIEYYYFNGGFQSAALIESSTLKPDKSGFIKSINTQPASEAIGYSFI